MQRERNENSEAEHLYVYEREVMFRLMDQMADKHDKLYERFEAYTAMDNKRFEKLQIRYYLSWGKLLGIAAIITIIISILMNNYLGAKNTAAVVKALESIPK